MRPAHPQAHDAHERMHRALKRQAIKPVRHTCTAQQRNLDAFEREYHDERPHETQGQQTPTSRCRISPRPYPERLPTVESPGHLLVGQITTGGSFRFRGYPLYLANTMVDEPIGHLPVP